MRKALLILTAVAAVGWMAAVGVTANPEGPRPKGPPPSTGPGQPHRPRPSTTPHGPPRRGGRGPFGRQHVPPMFRDLTDKQVGEILTFVREKMPWRYERLKALQESNPDLFRRTCRRLRFEIDQLRRLEKGDPEAYQAALEEHRLRTLVADLAARARQAGSTEERNRRVAELRDVLQRLFDAERKAREAQIRELEQRIHQLRQQLAERGQQRDRIIEELLERLLSGRQGPDDAEPPPPPAPGP